MSYNTKLTSENKSTQHTIQIKKEPLTPPKMVVPPFSRQVWWYLSMIEFGKARGEGTLDAKKRTETYETFLALNETIYEGFYDKNLIWGQIEAAYKITLSGENNLYDKLSVQEGEDYIITVWSK